jgi:hypothetical protein
MGGLAWGRLSLEEQLSDAKRSLPLGFRDVLEEQAILVSWRSTVDKVVVLGQTVDERPLGEGI